VSEDRPALEVSPGDVAGRRFAVIASAFNEPVVLRLLEGARGCFESHGLGDAEVTVAWTPGAFELALAARWAIDSGGVDAVVCLGAVIRGETAHFDFVAGRAASGIQRVALDTGVPVIFGVLTTDTVEQAMERAGGSRGNKGWDAALAAMQMVKILDQFAARKAEGEGTP
jgi:6,7-dimethyl-8-ribityllumazine synthase